MKSIKIIISVIVVGIMVICVVSCGENKSNLKKEVWESPSGKTYSIKILELNSQAKMLDKDDNYSVRHKKIGEIALYEFVPKACNGNLMLFLHDSGATKEVFFEQMRDYAAEGYYCSAIDFMGFGERKNSKKYMLAEICVASVQEIDFLIEYYTEKESLKNFGMVGISFGGSVVYQYCAYGKRMPGAVAVGCATPNLAKQPGITISNGKLEEPIWSEERLKRYAKNRNPMNNLSRFKKLPIITGNNTEDQLISVKDIRIVEKYLYRNGNKSARFYYYEDKTHGVSDEFVKLILPYMNSNLK